MRIAKISAAAAALTLAVAPIAVQADASRVAAPVDSESEIGGLNNGSQFAIIALVAGVIAGAIILTDSDDPASA
ncbi:hypothetical protein [Parerythrobacter jejuensis]|uniref:Ferrochelatase n=1 Tax=Parerythrobacter jejuensis TaxID=795812 RepID=A0A845AMJ7_9SPHN|nr:hypothetical protein [Parerythrobacter jejuensis]MXP30657.1 hypothetical protein [Parerythrobacter jejuensis]MXP33417.1 hypothetical protein [Parerythrobacter jejuensis]